MPPKRDLYSLLEPEVLARLELDSHPKNETHPFFDLPTPNRDRQAHEMRDEYVAIRAKELPPRKPLPASAVGRLALRRKEGVIKDAYRAKVCGDHAAARGDQGLADEMYQQEERFLKRAEEVV